MLWRVTGSRLSRRSALLATSVRDVEGLARRAEA